MGSWSYEQQALHFANEAKINRQVASVHLENQDDVVFWEPVLKHRHPGDYNFIFHSRSLKGNESSGCEQCLKYVGYLSKDFFVCIDSDLRNLTGKSQYSAKDFVAQTYCYSWENNICRGEDLQRRWTALCPDDSHNFDFDEFLKGYSDAAYEGLRHLVDALVAGDKSFFRTFLSILPNQCTSEEMKENASGLIRKISDSIASLVSERNLLSEKMVNESFSRNGVTSKNAYLYVQGHKVYDLVKYIGRMVCRCRGVSFERDILKTGFALEGYPDMDAIQNDLDFILNHPETSNS